MQLCLINDWSDRTFCHTRVLFSGCHTNTTPLLLVKRTVPCKARYIARVSVLLQEGKVRHLVSCSFFYLQLQLRNTAVF